MPLLLATVGEGLSPTMDQLRSPHSESPQLLHAEQRTRPRPRASLTQTSGPLFLSLRVFLSDLGLPAWCVEGSNVQRPRSGPAGRVCVAVLEGWWRGRSPDCVTKPTTGDVNLHLLSAWARCSHKGLMHPKPPRDF